MASIKLKPVDVVVVGAGVAGTIVAKELATTKLKIVELERGRMIEPSHDFAMPYVHDELKFDRHNELVQNLSRETITFRNELNEIALPMRELGSFKPGEAVGGAGLLWGGQAWRFSPWDFETRSRTVVRYGNSQIPDGCTSQDWGVTYDELEPYYDMFEEIYGVCGKAGNLNGEIQPGGNPFEGPRSREYPNPPPAASYAGWVFGQAAETLGYKPFPNPTASMTRPYKNPYGIVLGECVHGGFCGGFMCAMGARASPVTTVLPALLKHENYELRTRTNVIRVNLDSTKKRAVSITYIDARGQEVEQPADLIILATYTFNNTRLMLLSGIGTPYDPITGKGVVGRNYAYQSNGHVSLFFDDKTFNRFIGGGGVVTVIDEFNSDNFDHSGLGYIGGAYMSVNNNGATPIRNRPIPKGTQHWGSQWKKAIAQWYNHSFPITVHGGCQSHHHNYLDLDPTYRDAYGLPLLRMTFDFRENEHKMQLHLAQKAAEIAKVMNPSQMDVNPKITKMYSIAPYQSTHNTGGAVMGHDPETSAVNKYLQSWDVSNVFTIGASAFPQNSAYNPTGTVGALACWAADAIKETYLKRPALLV